jgi:hypothetical protein
LAEKRSRGSSRRSEKIMATSERDCQAQKEILDVLGKIAQWNIMIRTSLPSLCKIEVDQKLLEIITEYERIEKELQEKQKDIDYNNRWWRKGKT